MKYDVTHNLTSLKNDIKGTEKDIYKYEKMKIKDTNIYLILLESVFEKKPMVKSIIYLLFSNHTGYIM